MKIFSRQNKLAVKGKFAIMLLLLTLVACGSGTSSQQASTLLKANSVDVSRLPLSQLTVYVSGGGKVVHALRASDGKQRWNYPIADAANLTLVKGVLFVNAYDGSVTALSASNGQQLWRHQNGNFAYGDTFLATPTIVVYCSYQEPQHDPFGLTVGQVVRHVLNASDGNELWQADCGNFNISTELNGKLYIIKDSLSAYQETTGKKLWQTSFATNSLSTQPAIIGSTIYFNSGRDGLFALDTTNGKVLWKSSLSTNAVSFTSVAADQEHGIVYAGAGKTLYAFNARSGSRLWQMPIEGGGELMRPLVIAAGTIYVSAGVNASATEPYSFYALRSSDGKTLWRSRVTSSDRSRPVVASGVVFVGDWQGTLHALRVTDGTEIWHFPTGDIIQAPLALGA